MKLSVDRMLVYVYEIFYCCEDLRCAIASSVLGIGGKIPPKLLDASKDSKYDSLPLF